MEQTTSKDTDPTEMPPPSLGEAMSKILADMDSQGLLNEADHEDGPTDDGADLNKRGDEHAGQHEVSLSHSGSGSDSGTGAEQDGGNNRMEVEPPNFRIVDIEAPRMQTEDPQIPVLPVLNPNSSSALATAVGPQTGLEPVMNPVLNPAYNHSFAIPADPSALRFKNIPGMNFFQNAVTVNISEKKIQNNPNLPCTSKPNASDSGSGNTNANLNKVPSGVKAPIFPNPLPPKKPDQIEPDAVPPKSYEAIIENKKRKEKAGTIGGIASGQGPLECGSFYNKGDNRVLRSVYKEDVSSLSVSSMSFNPVTWKCSACPSAHSVFEANAKGGRTVIVLADQNFPAVLPSSENRCLSIIRLDQGGLDELIDLFLKIARQTTVPGGTVVLFGSLISLSKLGLQSYAAACINSKRRLSGGIKGVEAVPFVPPPWEAAMIRN